MLFDTMRLNFMLRWHPHHYIVERNGNVFDVYYRNLRHDNATGANNNNQIYIGTIARESILPYLNIIGRPVFYHTNEPALQRHPALTDALAVVRRHPRAAVRRQV